ncbi:hypothetical protein [Pseudoxanthomonas sp. 10H]|uniref:hypothetical protein n=1 Tax=Pseudoxanthomonas sp. 10H TaxID=3242729 RepID=UPI003557E4A7
MKGPGWATRLVAVSLAGQALAYALGVGLARHLGVAGFESYVVASAVFILMVTLAPQGLEKYSLKLLPPLVERRAADPLHGFLGFARRRVLLGSMVVAAVVGAWAWHAPGLAADTRLAVVLACLSLPAGAQVHLLLEVLTASGRPLFAGLVFRVLVPATTLAIVGLGLLLPRQPGAQAWWAIAAWGVAWGLAFALMARQVRRDWPGQAATRDTAASRRWMREARPFWIYRVSMGLLAQAAIVGLEWLQAPASAVGAFAAAFATAAVAQVLATATNRVYAGRLSLLLERGDIGAIHRLRMQRLRWLVPPLLAYLALVLGFAP